MAARWLIPAQLFWAALALDAALLSAFREGRSDTLLLLAGALAAAQMTLLAAWLVLGDAPALVRILLAAAGFVGLQTIFAPLAVDAKPLGLGVLCLLLAGQLWQRFRAAPRDASLAVAAGGRRLALVDLLVMMAAVGAALAYCRSVERYLISEPPAALVMRLAPVLLAALAIRAALTERVTIEHLVAPFAWALAIVAIVVPFAGERPGFAWFATVSLMLDCALMTVALLALRTSGLRWPRGVAVPIAQPAPVSAVRPLRLVDWRDELSHAQQ